jgi:uncharacterized damage-inducible protein DinB
MTKFDANSHDEREALLGFLESQRQGLRRAVHGLTDEQAKLAPSASALSLAGLIKHVADVERSWVEILRAEHNPARQSQYFASFQPGEEKLEDLLADYAASAEETAAAFLALADLDHPAPVPAGVPWFPKDIEAWTARWVLVHLIEETARHTGHADIIRETVDGAQAVELTAAVEGWPENGFVKPWRKPAER